MGDDPSALGLRYDGHKHPLCLRKSLFLTSDRMTENGKHTYNKRQNISAKMGVILCLMLRIGP